MSAAAVLAHQRAWWLTQGDVLAGLAELPDASVNCVVTSPPYWSLRDYGTASWTGGDPACDHIDERTSEAKNRLAGSQSGGFGNKTSTPQASNNRATVQYRDRCGKCGAVRVDQQIGLEPTPDAYVARLVAVFREVRRVLRQDGCCFVNLGDSYNNRSVARKSSHQGGLGFTSDDLSKSWATLTQEGRTRLSIADGDLKEKDLIGMPWMVAFALRADGWWLRSAITLCKRAPMPESCRDRPTSATEMLFLLTKAPRYWYDQDAVREPGDPANAAHHDRYAGTEIEAPKSRAMRAAGFALWRPTNGGLGYNPAGRNQRNWWEISPEPYPDAHFATFGTEIPRRAILAGCPSRVCPQCGAPWSRVTRPTAAYQAILDKQRGSLAQKGSHPAQSLLTGNVLSRADKSAVRDHETLGWEPACDCGNCPERKDGRHQWIDGADICARCGCDWEHRLREPVPGVVLDPFAGSGTSLLVALRLGRRALGIELSPAYVELATRRIVGDAPLFNTPDLGTPEAAG